MSRLGNIFGRRSRGYGNSYGRSSGGGMSGFKIRLFIALAIGAFTYVSYLSSSKENPITGKSQRVALTTDQEIAMGLQALPQMTRQHGGLLQDQRAQNFLDQLGSKLLRALPVYLETQNKKATNPYKFEFHLLADNRSINAFALPGGQVFITKALFDKLDSEAQIAGVIGHEIGHVLARHGAQRMAKQKLTQGLAQAVGMAGGGHDSMRVAMMVGQMVNMKYGREDELESDKWGVRLTRWAGYDPSAMLKVMHVLEKASGGSRTPEMMSTHPKPANRRAYIKEVIRSEFPEGIPTGLVQ